jgi:hypothetical protein
MPPWTEEDETEVAGSGDLGPMATNPVWLKTSCEDCSEDWSSGDEGLERSLEVYDDYIDETEGSKPNGKGMVETVKVISTRQASKRRRSP